MDTLLTGYWPWWIGGPAFALLVVGIWLAERRLLGVTGHYVQVLSPPSGSDQLDGASQAAIEAALMQATLAEFGPDAVAQLEAANAREAAPNQRERETMSWGAHALFLAMLPVGGALGALTAGTWHVRSTLGERHEQLVSSGAWTLVVLALGGVLVGLGVRMAGGCTSGHGLSGCSRLQPGSLAATASFFGTAIAVSFLLEALAK